MKNTTRKEFNRDKWSAKSFQLYEDLKQYLASLNLIGQTINKIVVLGYIYNNVENYYDFVNDKWFYYDDNNNYVPFEGEIEEYLLKPDDIEKCFLELDEPIILYIGEKQIEINYSENFNIQIGENTLDKTIISSISASETWQDVSVHFSKNIIGQKNTNIEINPYTITQDIKGEIYGIFTVDHKKGEKSFDRISFIFDNGYKLTIDVYCGDYMGVYENKTE